MIRRDVLAMMRVDPEKSFDLKDRATGWAQSKDLKALGKDAVKARAKEILKESLAELGKAQELLYADNSYSVLVILQAMDAAGKDGTIKHVMSGVNPQGCQVFSFKVPSNEELNHNFLWRYSRCLPERGRIGIFNRTYYEDVLVVKVHPELLDAQHIPAGKRGKGFWKSRYKDINAFEHHLVKNGTIIVKFFLNLSKKEQKKRFLDRLNRPEKNWKFSAGDLTERRYWDDYMKAYESALAATSTEWAPWHVIPADDKWATRAIVADILTTTISALDLKYPPISDAQKIAIDTARKELEAE